MLNNIIIFKILINKIQYTSYIHHENMYKLRENKILKISYTYKLNCKVRCKHKNHCESNINNDNLRLSIENYLQTNNFFLFHIIFNIKIFHYACQ